MTKKVKPLPNKRLGNLSHAPSDTYDRVPCVSKSSRHNKSPAAVVVGGAHFARNRT